MEPGLLDHLLFLFLGIIFPFQALVATRPVLQSIRNWDTRQKLAFYRGNSLVLLGLSLLLVAGWWLAGRPIGGLGLQLPKEGSMLKILVTATLFLGALGYELWRDMSRKRHRVQALAHLRKHTPFLPSTPRELRAFAWLSLSAAIGEEILFRGFLMTYLLAVFSHDPGGVWVALLFPACAFAIGHYYQGIEAVLKIGVLSLTLGVIFLLTQSLLYPMLLHLIVDLLGGWMGYRLLREDD